MISTYFRRCVCVVMPALNLASIMFICTEIFLGYSNEITKNNNNYICTLNFNNVVLNHTIQLD
jgi:hypothetical protein